MIRPGHGLEVVSKVNDIPKGSRLAVSTNLLASLDQPALMRATGQVAEPDRPPGPRRGAGRRRPGDPRGVAGRFGRRLAGLGRRLPGREDHPGRPRGRGRPRVGRQPGAAPPRPRDPERHPGRPGDADRRPGLPRALAESLVLVHGGMAQNVGPVLNMVTEKVSPPEPRAEWLARGRRRSGSSRRSSKPSARRTSAGSGADDAELGRADQGDHPLGQQPVHRDDHPKGQIRARRRLLGLPDARRDVRGGGMAFFVAPHRRDAFRETAKRDHATGTKSSLDDALPFAMDARRLRLPDQPPRVVRRPRQRATRR